MTLLPSLPEPPEPTVKINKSTNLYIFELTRFKKSFVPVKHIIKKGSGMENAKEDHVLSE